MFTPVETGDGSSTFYSETFGEWFHSREGACNEAQKTYVESSNLAARARGESLKILDVCYGLGYNTAAALETIWRVNPSCKVEIVGLEIDIEVARSAIAQGLTQSYSAYVQRVLQYLATEGYVVIPNDISPSDEHGLKTSLKAHLSIGDARQQIQPLLNQGWQADVIFLDPFSPPHCPQLWTVEFLANVAQCLHPDRGVLVTYSCAAAVRSALRLAGLTIGSIHAGGRKWPGTIASYYSTSDCSEELSPRSQQLSQQEKEHLQTRAAVPYRDPSQSATAEEILAQRLKEQSTSNLMPTQPWRLRWKSKRNALNKNSSS